MNKSEEDEKSYMMDLFRVIAVMMVLSVHINGYLNEHPHIVQLFFSLGAYGVSLFFLLSGFFTYSSIQKSSTIKEYLIKKAVRLLPLYYISLVMTFILDVYIYKDLPVSWKWLYHVVFLNMFVPCKEWMWWNSVNFFWTMPCFVVWYILSPVIYRYVNSFWKMASFVGIYSVIVPVIKEWMYGFTSTQFANWNFFSLLYTFLLGVLASLAISERKEIICAAYTVFLGIIGCIASNRSGFFLFGIVFLLLILAVHMFGLKIRSKIGRKILRMLSISSYATYLTHYFLLKIFYNFFGNLSWVLSYIVFIFSALCVGILIYNFVEKPITNALRHVIKMCAKGRNH